MWIYELEYYFVSYKYIYDIYKVLNTLINIYFNNLGRKEMRIKFLKI